MISNAFILLSSIDTPRMKAYCVFLSLFEYLISEGLMYAYKNFTMILSAVIGLYSDI